MAMAMSTMMLKMLMRRGRMRRGSMVVMMMLLGMFDLGGAAALSHFSAMMTDVDFRIILQRDSSSCDRM